MSLGSIVVRLTMNTADFDTDTKRASRIAQRRAKEIDDAFRKAGVAIGLALSAGIAIGVRAIDTAVDRMDELSKLSQKVGLPTEEVSAFAFAADMADVELSALQGGLMRLVKFQSDASKGAAENVALFEALDIAYENAADGSLRDTADVFRDLADVFASLPAEGPERAALALQVFGRSGADLIPILQGGSAELEEMTRRAEELGLVVSSDAGRAAEEFNDRLGELRLMVTGLAGAVAVDLLPDLNAMIGSFADGVTEGDRFAGTAHNIANGIRGIVFVAEKGFELIRGLTTGLAALSLGAFELAQKFSLNGVVGLLGKPSDDLANLRAVLGAQAGESAASFFGNGPQAAPVIRREQSRKPATEDRDHAAALAELRAATAGAAEATRGLADAERARREEAREAEKQAEREAEAKENLAEQLYEQQRELRELAAEEAQQRADAKKLVDDTLADIAFETQLLGLNNLEREKMIALRHANVTAASAEGQAIAAALDELDQASQQADGIAFIKGELGSLAQDLTDGAGKASDAWDDFFDNLRARVVQMLAEKLLDRLFSSASSGGSGGAGWVGFIGSLFGGARAGGGDVDAGKAYTVGENGRELFVPTTAGVIVPAGQTAAMLGGRSVNQNFNFMMPGRYDLRTQAQIASDAGRSAQRALARSTAA